MVHTMRVAFNQSGFLHREPKRCGLRISIKLLDEAARRLLLLFFSRYLFTLSSAPQISSSAPFPETTAQRPPAGRSVEQIYLGSPPPFPRSPRLFEPRVTGCSCSRRSCVPFIKASLQAVSTNARSSRLPSLRAHGA